MSGEFMSDEGEMSPGAPVEGESANAPTSAETVDTPTEVKTRKTRDKIAVAETKPKGSRGKKNVQPEAAQESAPASDETEVKQETQKGPLPYRELIKAYGDIKPAYSALLEDHTIQAQEIDRLRSELALRDAQAEPVDQLVSVNEEFKVETREAIELDIVQPPEEDPRVTILNQKIQQHQRAIVMLVLEFGQRMSEADLADIGGIMDRAFSVKLSLGTQIGRLSFPPEGTNFSVTLTKDSVAEKIEFEYDVDEAMFVLTMVTKDTSKEAKEVSES